MYILVVKHVHGPFDSRSDVHLMDAVRVVEAPQTCLMYRSVTRPSVLMVITIFVILESTYE